MDFPTIQVNASLPGASPETMAASVATPLPLGLAVVGGLVVSQLLTLYITPVFYIYMEKFRGLGRRRKAAPLPEAALTR